MSATRVVCLTENLGCGGAERQLVALSCLLKSQSYEVQVVTYHNAEFMRSKLDQQQIPLIQLNVQRGIPRIFAIRQCLLRLKPDVVIAFKNSPSLYTELAGIPTRKWKLMVSERSHNHRGQSLGTFLRLLAHHAADKVICNSHLQRKFICEAAPFLRAKTSTIWNCVALDYLKPAPLKPSRANRALRLLVLARVSYEKNPFRLLNVVQTLKRLRCDVEVDWYGSDYFSNGHPTRQSECYLKLRSEISKRGLGTKFRLHAPRNDVRDLLSGADALVLPSFYEGCSNAVCEALACGLPILASRTAGDNTLLVEDGKEGILFDPYSEDDMVAAIVRYSRQSDQECEEMAIAARRKAERELSPNRLLAQYVTLIQSLAHK